MDQHQALFHYLLYVRDRPSEDEMIRRLEATAARRQDARDSRRAAMRGLAARFGRLRHRRRTSNPTPATAVHGPASCRVCG